VTREAVARILLVEDEEALAEGLRVNLQRKQYEVDVAGDGRTGLASAQARRYDLILLDIRLPEIDGFEVCQRLRQDGNFTPILMLTARNQPDDVVYGLKLGADDYVTKPFDLAELLARIEGLLRRHEWWRQEREEGDVADPDRPEPQTPGPDSAGIGPAAAPAIDRDHTGGAAAAARPAGDARRVEFGPYWVDFRTWQARTRQGVVELSRKELAVLKLLVERPHEVVSRRELLAEVWELPNHPNTRVVDNVIVSLRRAFETDAAKPRHIISARGVGYRFVP
jgi:two-component system, OmpR family, alkaline phosphatase synthesis response regulator PhoP